METNATKEFTKAIKVEYEKKVIKDLSGSVGAQLAETVRKDALLIECNPVPK